MNLSKGDAAPVALFFYNRPVYADRILRNLDANYEAELTKLYIFADGAKKREDQTAVEEVKNIIENFKKNNRLKEVEVHYADRNKGLSVSIIEGINAVFSNHDKIIVLEDDLVLTRDFLKFMNACLDFFKDNPQIGAVSGFSFQLKSLKHEKNDIYLSRTGNSWGWATWKCIWEKVDWEVQSYQEFYQNKKERRRFDSMQYGISNMLDLQMKGKINSWAVRWDYHFFRNNLYTVYPRLSKVKNMGFDHMGTHCDSSMKDIFETNIYETPWEIQDVEPNKKIMRENAAVAGGKYRRLRRVVNIVRKRIKAE